MKLNYCEINRIKDGLNVLAKLASQNKKDEVNALLRSGGHLADAVYGYALGGHVAEVDGLLRQHPDLIKAAATGYARADNESQTQPLSNSKDILIKQALLRGYAQSANMIYVNAAVRDSSSPSNLPVIVEGLAEGGHTDFVMQYAINPELQNLAITAAARSGNTSLVTELLACQKITLSRLKKPLKPHEAAALSHALIGYTQGRHYELIEPLLHLNINPMLGLTAISSGQNIHPEDIKSISTNLLDPTLKRYVVDLIKTHFQAQMHADTAPKIR